MIIYNAIAIRRKAFIKDDVVQPIMQELQSLNIEGAALCDQYKLPVTGVLKGGLKEFRMTSLISNQSRRDWKKHPGWNLPNHLLGLIY